MAKAPLADGVVYFLLVYNAARIVLAMAGSSAKSLRPISVIRRLNMESPLPPDNDKFIVEAAIGVGRYYAR